MEQGFVVSPADKRFLLLFTFLKKNRKKKVGSKKSYVGNPYALKLALTNFEKKN